MELAANGTLAKFINTLKEVLPETRVRKTFLQLASALHHVHAECRMVHRDALPGNQVCN